MGYRVNYYPLGNGSRKRNRSSVKVALTSILFFVFCLLVNLLWAEGAEVIRRLIFSGDSVVTMAAMEELAIQLQNGADLTDSLKQFCLRILEGAGFASI